MKAVFSIYPHTFVDLSDPRKSATINDSKFLREKEKENVKSRLLIFVSFICETEVTHGSSFAHTYV